MWKKLSTGAIRDLAEANGVCIRPVLHEVTDTETGGVRVIATPCGATLASKCPPCAQKRRALRMQQCREGWHLDHEPESVEPEDEDEPEDENEEEQDEDEPPRRVRSTRRRQDTPDLPRLPMEKRTVGDTFVSPSGKTYRPSMFVTFTLPSYGAVREDGTPRDPHAYDYRRAALDALHFPKLIDRVWQNLRRVTGYQVQYFATVEAQRRGAPHLHAAIRGAIPRELLRAVARATYHQVWWPDHNAPRYVDDLPVWTEDHGYVDSHTGEPLPTWTEALDELDDDEDATPAHTLRLGTQLDMQGILATEGDADRRIGYLTKYLAKSFTESLSEAPELSRRQQAHVRRLNQEIRYLPCSPRCSNWLRFGVQPSEAKPGMVPGECTSKAHAEHSMGCGGRRVLVSRKWTGKTLQRHKADRAEVVRQTLLAAGVEVPELERLDTDVVRQDGEQRFQWRIWDAGEDRAPVYRTVLSRAITKQVQWRTDYQAAKARAGPATTAPRPPDNCRTVLVEGSVKGERSDSRSDTKCP